MCVWVEGEAHICKFKELHGHQQEEVMIPATSREGGVEKEGYLFLQGCTNAGAPTELQQISVTNTFARHRGHS